MDVCRPLGAGLFFYELLRVLLLVIFSFIAPPGGVNGAFSPYLVYLSANALFPLMALFVWLREEEYRNYLTLYIAGKIIALVSFYIWEIFSYRWGGGGLSIPALTGPGGVFSGFPEMEHAAKGLIILAGCVFISLADIFSVCGAWMLKNKFRRTSARESGGL
jgi:hypothetical protein